MRHLPATGNTSRLVDVVAGFDTTGSMSDKIRALIATMADVVAELGRMQLDWRFTTVPFGDLTVPGDRVVTDRAFVATVDQAQSQLRHLPRFSGGGNVGEPSAEAMLAATALKFRPNAVKVLVLLTDEPALGGPQRLGAVDGALTALDAMCFTIAPPNDYFRRWAAEHGGEWRQVAAGVDTAALVAMFNMLMRRAVEVVDEVHTHYNGSVPRYLKRVVSELPLGAAPRALRRALDGAGSAAPPLPARVTRALPRPPRSSPRAVTRAADRSSLGDGRVERPELGPGH